MFVVPCWHCEDSIVQLLDEGVQQSILRSAILKMVLKAFASFLQLYIPLCFHCAEGFPKFEDQEDSANLTLTEKPSVTIAASRKFGTDAGDNPFLKVNAGIWTPFGDGVWCILPQASQGVAATGSHLALQPGNVTPMALSQGLSRPACS